MTRQPRAGGPSPTKTDGGRAPKAGRGISAKKLDDWVSEFLSGSPEAADDLKRAGIHDDETYLKNERLLSSPIGTALDEFRADFFSRASEGPLDLVRRSPRWFRSLEFERLDLTLRVRNVLVNNHISRVSDLDRYSETTLMNLQNFGVTSQRDLAEALLGTLIRGWRDAGEPEEGTDSESAPPHKPGMHGLDRWISKFLSEFPDRADDLKRAGIRDDETYLRNKSRLPGQAATELELFRDNFLTRGATNPVDLARRSPRWFRSLELNRLEMMRRTRNVLVVNNIWIVSDLDRFSDEPIRRLRYFGAVSERDLTRSMIEGLKRGLPDGD